MKDKNVDFNAGKWKNEITHPGFEPGTSQRASMGKYENHQC